MGYAYVAYPIKYDVVPTLALSKSGFESKRQSFLSARCGELPLYDSIFIIAFFEKRFKPVQFFLKESLWFQKPF